jgi:hypothetical protein
MEAESPSHVRRISDFAGKPAPVTTTRSPTDPLDGESSILAPPAYVGTNGTARAATPMTITRVAIQSRARRGVLDREAGSSLTQRVPSQNIRSVLPSATRLTA